MSARLIPSEVASAHRIEEVRLVHAGIEGELLVVAGIVRGRCLRVAAPAEALFGAPDVDGCEADVHYMRALLCARANSAKALQTYFH
ncbi:MAG: hypothetical protein M0015_05870 [Betaproteobacteria bacterium]|nr:hypothetical protein [Betaproteobacteria bacterium]